MKSMLVTIALGLAVAIGSVSLHAKEAKRNRKKKDATSVPTSVPATKAAVFNKNCAVEQDNPVDPKVPTVVYNGKVIGFCCEDCVKPFQKDPEKYMKTIK
jgi:hypothetical protein